MDSTYTLEFTLNFTTEFIDFDVDELGITCKLYIYDDFQETFTDLPEYVLDDIVQQFIDENLYADRLVDDYGFEITHPSILEDYLDVRIYGYKFNGDD